MIVYRIPYTCTSTILFTPYALSVCCTHEYTTLTHNKARETVHFVPDVEVSLAAILAKPLPPLPREASCRLHWLAVEGVQPIVPENPTTVDLPEGGGGGFGRPERGGGGFGLPEGGGGGASCTNRPGPPPPARRSRFDHNVSMTPIAKHPLTREHQA
jgi:hypothetical protein